jgi:hypothetical protein
MEEHQNNTDVQNTQADSGEGTPKVIKAGNEAKAGRRVLRGGTSNGGNAGEGSDHAAEAARNVVRAGQQAVEGVRAATYAAADAANPVEASDHAAEAARSGATEAARSVARAGQQAVEGVRAATYAAVDESTGSGKVLDEWANFFKRAMERNTQALGDLIHCYTLPSLMQWQNHLLNATITDLWETNSRILQSVTHKA